VSVHRRVIRNSSCLSHLFLLFSRTYLWYDEKGKKNRCPAPQYIDYVMTYTQRTISDESYFPTKYANQFPSGFESHVRKMLRLLFHVIAHMYAAHFREIALLGLHPHLNSTFALLVALQRSVNRRVLSPWCRLLITSASLPTRRRFNLIEPKEMEVLSDLEAALHLTDDTAPSTTTSAPSATTQASSVASNNSSSSVSSSSNLYSNTTVTQAIISSPSRSGAAASPFDGVPIPNSQIDDVSVIVKQPVSGGDGASSLLNNNNDVSAKDRTHVTAVVGTPPI
jgi:Mob1/phocein family